MALTLPQIYGVMLAICFFFFVWKLERSSGKSEEEGLEHEIVWHAGQKKETPGNWERIIGTENEEGLAIWREKEDLREGKAK